MSWREGSRGPRRREPPGERRALGLGARGQWDRTMGSAQEPEVVGPLLLGIFTRKIHEGGKDNQGTPFAVPGPASTWDI